MKRFIKLENSFFCIDSIIAIEPAIDNDKSCFVTTQTSTFEIIMSVEEFFEYLQNEDNYFYLPNMMKYKNPIKSDEDSVRESVWSSVGESVWESVFYSVRGSVEDSVVETVWYSVWYSVRDSVFYSVFYSVRGSVEDSVVETVWTSVLEALRDE